MKECVKLENVQEVPKEVIEDRKVTIEEIHEALREIERQRIEDNKSRLVIMFERLFKKGGEE